MLKKVNNLLFMAKREAEIRTERQKYRVVIQAIERMTTQQLKELVKNDCSDERIREICVSVGLIVE